MEKLYKEIIINTEYIQLNQLLKLANIVSSGAEAKYATLSGHIFVGGEKATEIRKKIYPEMVVEVNYEGRITTIKVQ